MEPETALQFLVQNLLQATRNFESNDFEWLIPINEAKPKRRVVLNPTIHPFFQKLHCIKNNMQKCVIPKIEDKSVLEGHFLTVFFPRE